MGVSGPALLALEFKRGSIESVVEVSAGAKEAETSDAKWRKG